MAKAPTYWNPNPIASTSNLINYDVSTEPYDNASQPYDGVLQGESLLNWKNPTYYTPLSELYQQYYGGPTSVPLFAAPSTWVFNPGINNQNATYVPSEGATADLDIYDNSTDSYDGSNSAVSPNYDSTNNGLSFNSWKKPTSWAPITGGSF